MRKLLISIVTLCSLVSYADDFYIEDESLTSVDKSIEEIIKNSSLFKENYKKCDVIIGKSLKLSEGKFSTIVATTDGCGWGAAVGPIWIVKKDVKAELILSASGYSLKVDKSNHKGFYDIQTLISTSAGSNAINWRYDGLKYKNINRKLKK